MDGSQNRGSRVGLLEVLKTLLDSLTRFDNLADSLDDFRTVEKLVIFKGLHKLFFVSGRLSPEMSEQIDGIFADHDISAR